MALRVVDTPESRVFDVECDNGQIRTLRVRKATTKELEAADLEFSRMFNKSLFAGLPPRARMLRKLRESKIWTPDDDQKLDGLRTSVALTGTQLETVNKQLDNLTKDAEGKVMDLATLSDENQAKVKELEEQKLALTKTRATVYVDLRRLNMEVDQMLGHTADAKADDAQRNFLMACVTEEVELADDKVTKVKSRVWASVDNMNSEKDSNLQQRAIYEFMMFDNGLPSEWNMDTAKDAPAEPTTDKGGDAPVQVEGDAASTSEASATAVA